MAEIDKKEARLDALAVPREGKGKKKILVSGVFVAPLLSCFFGSAVVLLFATLRLIRE